MNGMKMPASPWISFPALISVLGRFLPSDAITLISKYHQEYKVSFYSLNLYYIILIIIIKVNLII